MFLHGAHPHQGHPKERKRQRKGSQVECPKPWCCLKRALKPIGREKPTSKLEREPSYTLCEARLLAPPNPIKKQNDQKHEKQH
jgi:hypothetical protein